MKQSMEDATNVELIKERYDKPNSKIICVVVYKIKMDVLNLGFDIDYVIKLQQSRRN